MKALVIVESPAKARTISRYLGDGYTVESSVGHIRDLPVSAAGRKNSLGIDFDTWEADYQILPDKEKIVAQLRKQAKTASCIYLATDLDREGEAIAWHLREAIGDKGADYRRVIFNEVTRSAILKAFEDPREIDINRVNSQQARRFLDRLVGFKISPLLWRKIARGLSAGRVQSVAVRLIVERERQIRAFVSKEYWELRADLRGAKKPSVRFLVTHRGGKRFSPGSRAEIDAALAQLHPADYTVSSCEEKPTRMRPAPPLITSTLQQMASSWLRFSTRRTMTLAQQLYEAGHITYTRTDSTNISEEALKSCRETIAEQYGERYLPSVPRRYASRAGSQEAHEAIRPTSVSVEQPAGADAVQRQLYQLIRQRFLACQMADAEFLSTRVLVQAEDFQLQVRGRICTFDGHTRALPFRTTDGDEAQIPRLEQGEVLKLEELLPEQKFTKPPQRFSEAALVRQLEKYGIGRPSTYSTIISTIQARGYVDIKERRFHSNKIGEIVTDRLLENFPDLMDYGFTASMEEGLDRIADGEIEWKRLLTDFYSGFSEVLEQALEKMQGKQPLGTGIPCLSCNGTMQVRFGTNGAFLGCENFSAESKCSQTINLQLQEQNQASEDLRRQRRCGQCNSIANTYLVDSATKLHLCSNSPACPGLEIEHGDFDYQIPDAVEIDCDRCGAVMALRSGRFGQYFDCTGEDCKNKRKLLADGTPAPSTMDPIPMPQLRCAKVDDHYLLREGASGLFLAASKFPKNRETRSPKIEELHLVADQLESKWQFLLTAPVADPNGNETVLRFNRKAREHYVGSRDSNGKWTRWTSSYNGSGWIEGAGSGSRTTTRKKARRPRKK